MTYDEFADALDGLLAFDTGCVNSGIHDEGLRASVKQQIPAHEDWLAWFVRDRMLSDEALSQGYGIEDVAVFLDWLAERMDLDLGFNALQRHR